MDTKLIETGDGGDLELSGNDLALIDGLQNMPYLAMFGGNPGELTEGAKLPDQQAFDWWGNNLLFPNDYAIQFNSLLEKRLSTIALNSSGRIQLEQAVKTDLDFMLAFAEVTVEVLIVTVDRAQINIKIQEPDNLQSNAFTYIWDATEQELTTTA